MTMSATTPIYQLEYPTGDDLVKNAPTSFRDLANSVETALNEVDARATPEGSTPVVRNTLALLKQTAGVTGQTGYVTGDSDEQNNGPYFYNGSSWEQYPRTITKTTSIEALNGVATIMRNGKVVTVDIDAKYHSQWRINTGESRNLLSANTLPAPPVNLCFPVICNGGGNWDLHFTASVNTSGGLGIVCRTGVTFGVDEGPRFTLTYIAK